VILTINSDYFTRQHCPVGLGNGKPLCVCVCVCLCVCVWVLDVYNRPSEPDLLLGRR
jgi:hypothetical protein